MGAGVSREFGTGGTIPAPEASRAAQALRRARRPGLSARLFLITVAFVGLAETMIYVPAVTSFRLAWLSERVAAARIAALTLDATPEGHVSDGLARRLLAGVGVREIAVQADVGRRSLGSDVAPGEIADTVDLRRTGWIDAAAGAWRTLSLPAETPIRVIGSVQEPGRDDVVTVEIVLDEAALRQAMVAFSLRLLLSSLVIAAAAAALVFVMLQRAFVQPMRRLARNIAAFADEPENADRVIVPSDRQDEIGDAESALARMEIALAGELRRKRRLAGLGLSVSKISHELRNLLTTAQLLGDRLEKVADPLAQRVAPRLVATLDRANRYCESTLAYGRAAEQHPQRRMTELAAILAELPDLAGLARGRQVQLHAEVPPGLMIDADPEQFSRALTNLMRNAVQALDASPPPLEAPRVTVEARRQGAAGAGQVVVTVADNGPGLPERSKTHLFTPFQGSMRAGGTGLGLAIASELVELHGGTLGLDATATGARFRIVIPDRPAPSEAG